MPLPRPLASVPSTAGAAVPPRAPPPRPSRRDVLGAALLTALLPLPRPARADDGAPPAGAGLLARMPAQEAPIGEPAPAPVDAGRAEEAGSPISNFKFQISNSMMPLVKDNEKMPLFDSVNFSIFLPFIII